ncbi:MAG: YbfB/YjiJ family MFS transporter [Rhodoferax sp.]|nr:YbfB/YjiJ family MFS transporter [Rhodoferax sp.]
MTADRHPISALKITLIGFAALASAMGVGRFAFTPLLPLMQAHAGMSLRQGAWLAEVNYIGYLAGAMLCSITVPVPRHAVRFGLVAVALLTLGMGVTGGFAAWLALRFGAGVASAYVLVGVSAWALPALAGHDRSVWSGWLFAGVGVGMSLAGLVVLLAGAGGYPPDAAWLVLGLASTVVAAVAWAPMRTAGSVAAASVRKAGRLGADGWRLVLCYATFGFGYIIPATFLPAMARDVIADPAVFGWVWPVFGATAAVSTVAVALGSRRMQARRVWALGQLVMAAGVLAPVLFPGIGTLLVAAVCVGGTFMVNTMAGMQEARRIAGAHAPKLMAAMTTAFALGQLAGPIIVAMAAADGARHGAGPSLLAVALLLAGAWALWRPQPVL